MPGSRLGVAGRGARRSSWSLAAAPAVVRVGAVTPVAGRSGRSSCAGSSAGRWPSELGGARTRSAGWPRTSPAAGCCATAPGCSALAAPLMVVLVAARCDGAARARCPTAPARVLVAGVLALVPLALMPDAAWGMRRPAGRRGLPGGVRRRARRGRRTPRPATRARCPSRATAPRPGTTRRRVLDPLGRYLGRRHVVNDELVVSGRPHRGGGPARRRGAARARGARRPTSGPPRCAPLGISVVVVEQIAGYPTCPRSRASDVARRRPHRRRAGGPGAPAPVRVAAATWPPGGAGCCAVRRRWLRAVRRRRDPVADDASGDRGSRNVATVAVLDW